MSMRYGVQVSPAFFMGIIIFSATLEAVALTRIRTSDYTPGDLGFDPLRCEGGAARCGLCVVMHTCPGARVRILRA